MRINSDADYYQAYARLEELLSAGAGEGCETDELVGCIAAYEARHPTVGYPTPVEALEFFLDQHDVGIDALAKYLGDDVRMAEKVVSGEIPITARLARALNKDLNIPLDLLLQDPRGCNAWGGAWGDVDLSDLPLKDMAKRGWIPQIENLYEKADRLVANLVHRAGGTEALVAVPMPRKTDSLRVWKTTNKHALRAWCWQVLAVANESPLRVHYEHGVITDDFIQSFVHLSENDNGPLQAKTTLAERGIVLIVERHLPKTYLDGAAIRLQGRNPVIGLTLRQDRIDNFWFTLMHELAHIELHLGDNGSFIDEMESESGDSREREADRWAADALIPSEEWSESDLCFRTTPSKIRYFAHEWGIHPAIVAGRIRKETGNYNRFSNLLGYSQVRQQFI